MSEESKAFIPGPANPREAVPFTSTLAGAGWLKRVLKRDLSPFESTVAEILGVAYAGIYHIEEDVLRKSAVWKDWIVQVNVYGDMATYDGMNLTALVVLCHDAAVRLSIGPVGTKALKLSFWPRAHRPERDSFATRHPFLEESAARIRSLYREP